MQVVQQEGVSSSGYSLVIQDLELDMREEGFQDAVTTTIVNAPCPLRNKDDRFGRNISELRRKLTDNDTKPLNII